MDHKSSPIKNDESLADRSLRENGFSDWAIRILADSVDRVVARGMTGRIPTSILLWSVIQWEMTPERELLTMCIADFNAFRAHVEQSIQKFSEKPVPYIDFADVSGVAINSRDVAEKEARTYIDTLDLIVAISMSDDIGGRILHAHGAGQQALTDAKIAMDEEWNV